MPQAWRDRIVAAAICRRWVDPFGGSLALPLEIRPHSAVIGDVNHDLINFWSWVKSGRFRFPRELEQPGEAIYYKRRAEFNGLSEPDRRSSLRAAQLFYYLNHAGYNGLIRYNKDSGFNVSWGGDRNPSWRHTLPEFADPMAHWKLQSGHYSQILRRLDPSDFLFLDPPYVAEPDAEDKPFGGYWITRFDWPEQIDLARMAGKHQGPIVACNTWEPRIIKLYEDQGFEIHQIMMPRSISCDGKTRGKKPEMLAIKNMGEIK